MLTTWEADGTRFGKQFASHAEDYRAAATGYVDTDAEGAEGSMTLPQRCEVTSWA